MAGALLAGTHCIAAQTLQDQQAASREQPASPLGSEKRIKTPQEQALEGAIDDGYRSCFKDYRIEGRHLLLRIPFGENGERSEEGVFAQEIFLGGKAEPQEIWREIDSLLASDDFTLYAQGVSLPGAKAIVFGIDRSGWSISIDPQDAGPLAGGPYPGSRTEVHVLKRDQELNTEDVYNYLYCIGAVGMDCSGFVYNMQKSLARGLGADLDGIVGKSLRTPPEEVPRIMGLWYFDPANGQAESVDDTISNLRPGDIFLFRGRRGEFRHSAVIQSIDLEEGTIRYLQCTDWAPQQERGVHESFIYFDPANPAVSLRDQSIRWTQAVLPAFRGEPGLRYWKDDGDRYRTSWPTGQSLVVRLKLVRRLIEAAQPAFYSSRAEYDTGLLD